MTSQTIPNKPPKTKRKATEGLNQIGQGQAAGMEKQTGTAETVSCTRQLK